MPTSDYLLSRRNDLSGYLVHLTRDYQNKSAKKNLLSILKSRCIEARNAYCLFMSEIGKLRPAHARHFRTVCFTETPLSELNYVTQTMEDRSIHLSQYGVVFDKEVIRQAGGNPVFISIPAPMKANEDATRSGTVFVKHKRLDFDPILLLHFFRISIKWMAK